MGESYNLNRKVKGGRKHQTGLPWDGGLSITPAELHAMYPDDYPAPYEGCHE